jgi:hypothetical protein
MKREYHRFTAAVCTRDLILMDPIGMLISFEDFCFCCRGQYIQIKTHNLYFLEYKINTVVHMVYYVGDTIIFIPIRNIFCHFTLDFALVLQFKIEINIRQKHAKNKKKIQIFMNQKLNVYS